jgi:transcription elongation factor/antiterminator RfaH
MSTEMFPSHQPPRAIPEKPAEVGHGQMRWYAVQCLSHRESGAAANLGNQGFRVFLPRRRKTRRHARKTETVLVPFFPGYLFVALDLTRDRWRCVNGTYGVAGLVMHGDRPASVPPGIVEALQDSCDDADVLLWEPELKLGKPVRIMTGAFADFIGELDRLYASARVRVLLDVLGSRVPALVPRESVISADSLN